MAAKIRKGDKVVILAGKDKGKTGEVLQIIPSETRALVQGINLVRRHTKQTASQDAGIFTKPAPIHLSNIALIDPKSEPNKPKPTRVGFKISDDGKKVRVAKSTGETIDG
jgi:large subunit ribosomal protein L24